MTHTTINPQSFFIALCLALTPGAASAQSALDVLAKGSSESSARKTTSTGSHRLDSNTMSLTQLEDVTSESWLKPSKPYKGIHLLGPECQGHMLVSEHQKTRHEKSGDQRYSVLDLHKGELLDAPEGLMGSSLCEGDYILTGSEREPAAFHIPSRTWYRPRFSSLAPKEGGRSVVIPISQEGEPATSFLVEYTLADGSAMYGTWAPEADEVVLREDFPWDDVSQARFVGERIELIGHTLESTTAKSMFGGTQRRVTRHRAMMCEVDDVGITTPYHFDYESGITFIPGGYLALEQRTQEIAVRRPDGTLDTTEISGCKTHSPPSIQAVGSHASSVLYGCHLKEGGQAFVWWTPTGFSPWNAASKEVSFNLWNSWFAPTQPHNRELPIVQLNYYDTSSVMQSKWFDTRTGMLWEGDASYSINVTTETLLNRELPGRFFATSEHHDMYKRTTQRVELYIVDIEQASETLLHTYTDCPGEIETPFMFDSLVEVRCMTHFGSGYKALKQKWAEVINVDTQERWRIPKNHRVEQILHDGTVILGSFKKGSLPEHSYANALRIVTPFAP